MDRRTLPPLLLLLLAVILYLLPGHILARWRLGLYSLYVQAAESLHPEPEAPSLLPSGTDTAIQDLLDNLQQKDAEIARLRRQLRELKLTQKHLPTLRLQTASVLELGSQTHSDTVTIDQGWRDKVRDLDAVVKGQALVGTVARTGAKAAIVTLVSSPASLVSARIGTTREQCSVIGNGHGRARAVFYHISVKARKGDTVLTSGLLGSTPAGLLVGRLLEDPREGTEPNTTEAQIQLHADLTVLEDLLLVRQQKNPELVPRQPGQNLR